LLARDRDLDAGRGQSLDHRDILGHDDGPTRAGEAHFETRIHRPWRDLRCAEELAMHPLLRPAACGRQGQDDVDEALGTADVDVAAGPRLLQQACQVDALCRVAVVAVHVRAGAECAVAQPVSERDPVCAAHAVVQREVAARDRQVLGHAQDRGDADAAREQQAVPRVGRQREEIARRADAQRVTFSHLLVHRLRPAA
jgi:hypothetical protein